MEDFQADGPFFTYGLNTAASASAADTDEKAVSQPERTEFRLKNTKTGALADVFFAKWNTDLRLVRYRPLTAPPTAFATVNFDYEFLYSAKGKIGDVTLLIQDSAGNDLVSLAVGAFPMTCGVTAFNRQKDFDPKYFDVATQLFLRIRWGGSTGSPFKFKRCP